MYESEVKSTPRLQAVVFDLDGVLANTEDLYEIACSELLQRRGRSYEPALRERMMGRPVADSIRILIDAHGFNEGPDALILECREILQALLETQLQPMPGVAELFNWLDDAKLPFGLATSALRDYVEFVLGRMEIRERFQFILTAEDIRQGKPHPEIYLLASRNLDVPPGQMMVLEDSANGCRAAVAAGAFTVAVPNRHTMKHDFSGAQFEANTLADPRIVAALVQHKQL
ncbi:MAG: HAD family phosphatase [Pirellulales bacterium]|nr:HAD family phosphatase [Pirellulales bacterium]